MQRTLQKRLRGHATVTQNGVTISQVSYDLTVTETINPVENIRGERIGEERSGSTTGTLQPEDGVDLLGENGLFLHLADGRIVTFAAKSRRRPSMRAEIEGSVPH